MAGKRRIPREIRVCAALGCKNTFECMINGTKKYCCGGHASLGKPKPEGFGEKISKALTGIKRSEETKKKIGVASKGRKIWCEGLTVETDERVRKAVEKSTKTIRLQYLNGRKGTGTDKHYPRSKEIRLQTSITCKKKYQDPEFLKWFRSKCCRKETHHNWKGGISSEPYPYEWNKYLKKSIRKRDKYICQVCNKTEQENKRRLTVHHIDYVKENLNPNNLISLCTSCHITTNYNKKY